MNSLTDAFIQAGKLLISGDENLTEIIVLSLQVSLGAVLFAMLIGLPLGAALALWRFRGRQAVLIVLNSLMGLPPVVVGLLIYMLLSRSGPLGFLSLLFTPSAMMIAQCVLITPIIAAIARQIIADLWTEYEEQLRSLGLTPTRAIPTLLWEGRFSLLTAVMAGFGRAISEVGAVLIVGGNIAHVTRTMTTAIALETSKGELTLALALGFVLILLAILVNALVALCRRVVARHDGLPGGAYA